MVAEAISPETDLVVHLAASKRVNTDRPRQQFTDNSDITYNILERMDAVGDVPKMCLGIDRLADLGWVPEQSSDEAVRRSVRDLIDE